MYENINRHSLKYHLQWFPSSKSNDNWSELKRHKFHTITKGEKCLNKKYLNRK